MLLEKIQLEDSEKIVTQVRRHWFIIVSQLASLVLALLLPGALLFGVAQLPTEITGEVTLAKYTGMIVFVYAVWALLLWTTAFSIWTNYYLDVFTLTDRRVLLINQKGFFRRNVASFRLERLQDMNIEINGLLATLLDYGDLHVETAGHSEEEFLATSLPKPRELKGLITGASDHRILDSITDTAI